MGKQPHAELWIKLTLGGAGQIGPGKIDLLRRIGEYQSIAAAARSMDMSYRRAWLLVDELNKLLAQPVVAKWQGGRLRGGASLTRFGERLIEIYDTMVGRAHEANADLLAEFERSAGTAASRSG
jgi:molybdate transport system regulatory protein